MTCSIDFPANWAMKKPGNRLDYIIRDYSLHIGIIIIRYKDPLLTSQDSMKVYRKFCFCPDSLRAESLVFFALLDLELYVFVLFFGVISSPFGMRRSTFLQPSMLELSNYRILETYINMHAFSYPKQMLSSIARLTFLQNNVLSYFQVSKDPLEKCKISAVQVRFWGPVGFHPSFILKQNNRIWQMIGAPCIEFIPPCSWYIYDKSFPATGKI